MREKLRLKLRRKKILKSGSRADVTKKKGDKKTTRDKRPNIEDDRSKKRGSKVNPKSPLSSVMKFLGKARKSAVPQKGVNIKGKRRNKIKTQIESISNVIRGNLNKPKKKKKQKKQKNKKKGNSKSIKKHTENSKAQASFKSRKTFQSRAGEIIENMKKSSAIAFGAKLISLRKNKKSNVNRQVEKISNEKAVSKNKKTSNVAKQDTKANKRNKMKAKKDRPVLSKQDSTRNILTSSISSAKNHFISKVDFLRQFYPLTNVEKNEQNASNGNENASESPSGIPNSSKHKNQTQENILKAVSYTHLTLPTILLV